MQAADFHFEDATRLLALAGQLGGDALRVEAARRHLQVARADAAHLPKDARFATNGKRVENRTELTRLLQGIFAKRATQEWLELLEAAGVPNGPINDVAQVFAEPQVQARGVRVELEHPAAGKLPTVAMLSGAAIGESYLRPVDY